MDIFFADDSQENEGFCSPSSGSCDRDQGSKSLIQLREYDQNGEDFMNQLISTVYNLDEGKLHNIALIKLV